MEYAKDAKKCLSCGNPLQYYTHICSMTKTVSALHGCPECNNICPYCDYQSVHYGKYTMRREKVVDLTKMLLTAQKS